jgi:hypothetical protein
MALIGVAFAFAFVLCFWSFVLNALLNCLIFGLFLSEFDSIFHPAASSP